MSTERRECLHFGEFRVLECWSLTVLWRVVAQQGRLSLTLVGVGTHIVYTGGITKERETKR